MNERKERTVWRKYLQYEDGEMFLDKEKSAGIFCVREVSGYAVWYCRNLNDKESGNTPDGNYLLRFFAPEARHQAIEFAVLAAKPGLSEDEAIAVLDAEVKNVLSMVSPIEIKSAFE